MRATLCLFRAPFCNEMLDPESTIEALATAGKEKRSPGRNKSPLPRHVHLVSPSPPSSLLFFFSLSSSRAISPSTHTDRDGTRQGEKKKVHEYIQVENLCSRVSKLMADASARGPRGGEDDRLIELKTGAELPLPPEFAWTSVLTLRVLQVLKPASSFIRRSIMEMNEPVINKPPLIY